MSKRGGWCSTTWMEVSVNDDQMFDLIMDCMDGWNEVERKWAYEDMGWHYFYGIYTNGAKFYRITWGDSGGSIDTQECVEVKPVIIFTDLILAIDGEDGVADEDVQKLINIVDWKKV